MNSTNRTTVALFLLIAVYGLVYWATSFVPIPELKQLTKRSVRPGFERIPATVTVIPHPDGAVANQNVTNASDSSIQPNSISFQIAELTDSGETTPFNNVCRLQNQETGAVIEVPVQNGEFHAEDLPYGQYLISTDREHIFVPKQPSPIEMTWQNAETLFRFDASVSNASWLAIPLTRVRIENQTDIKLFYSLNAFPDRFTEAIKLYDPNFESNLPLKTRLVSAELSQIESATQCLLMPGVYDGYISKITDLPGLNRFGNPKRQFDIIFSMKETIPMTDQEHTLAVNLDAYGSIDGVIDSDLMDGRFVYVVDPEKSNGNNQFDAMVRKQMGDVMDDPNLMRMMNGNVPSTTIQKDHFHFDYIPEGKYVIRLEVNPNLKKFSDPFEVKRGQTTRVSFHGFKYQPDEVQFKIVEHFGNPIRNYVVEIMQAGVGRKFKSDEEGNVKATLIHGAKNEIGIAVYPERGMRLKSARVRFDASKLDGATVRFDNVGRLSFVIHDPDRANEELQLTIRNKTGNEDALLFNPLDESLFARAEIENATLIEVAPLGKLSFYGGAPGPIVLLAEKTFDSSEIMEIDYPKEIVHITFQDKDGKPVQGVQLTKLDRDAMVLNGDPSTLFHSLGGQYYSDSNGRMSVYLNNGNRFVYYHPYFGLGVLEVSEEQKNAGTIEQVIYPKSLISVKKATNVLTYFVLRLHDDSHAVFFGNNDISIPIQPGSWWYGAIESHSDIRKFITRKEWANKLTMTKIE
ncbi:MAG: hypothetical protein GC154_17180 [bacterium]|nr:hypothetical protein [bacterium]